MNVTFSDTLFGKNNYKNVPKSSTEKNVVIMTHMYRKEVSRPSKISDPIQKMAPLIPDHDISLFWKYCISEPSPSQGQKVQQFLGK